MTRRYLKLLFQAIILIATVELAACSSFCEPDWRKDDVTGDCYKFFESELNWFESRGSCRQYSAELTSIRSSQEQFFVAGLFAFRTTGPGVWVGGTDLDTEGVWVWSDNKPWWHGKIWVNGEPNNYGGREHCAHMTFGSTTPGELTDNDCYKSMMYVCKKKERAVINAGHYIGCFLDSFYAPDMEDRYTLEDNTPENCMEACLSGRPGYRYVGLQNGDLCFCGSYYGQHGRLPETSCDMPCPGKGNQTCGGFDVNSVYAARLLVFEENDYIGCFKDSDTEGRDLETENRFDFNTPELCTAFCRSQGELFAGVQNGDYCYCGSSYGKYGVLSDISCDSSCVGDPVLKCGGHIKNSIYSTGCFQTPVCTNQSKSIFDVQSIGEELFRVQVLEPSGYFTGQSFQGLDFSIDSSTLDAVTIDSSTGQIMTTREIIPSAWYPSKHLSIVVRVGNSQSCGRESMCTMSVTVTFKNLPIQISLPTNVSVLEDHDDRKLLTVVNVSDGNPPDQDNVTCRLTNNPAPNLLELVHDGNHNRNSYALWKLNCTDPGCGPLCDMNKGCLNHKLTSEYDVEIECYDGYGSSDKQSVKIIILKNEPPILNLPVTVTTTRLHSVGDTVFTLSITNMPADESVEQQLHSGVNDSYILGTENLFSFDDNDGRILINAEPRQEFSQTFEMIICVEDRRQEVCGKLTIIFYGCFQAPTCADQTKAIFANNHNVGEELFTMIVPPPTGAFSGQTFLGLFFVLENSTLDVATIQMSNGILTTTGDIRTDPWAFNKNYSLTVRVGNSESCDHVSTCTMSLTVTFTNLPTEIQNLPASVTVYKKEMSRRLLITISVHDGNQPEQTITCSMTTSSLLFELVVDITHTPHLYSVWKKECTETHCVGDAGEDEYKVEITCSDGFGSSDTKTLTVIVTANDTIDVKNGTGASKLSTILFGTCIAVGALLIIAVITTFLLKGTSNKSFIRPV